MELFKGKGKGKPEMQNLLKNNKMLLLLGALGVVLLFNPFAWFKGSTATPQQAATAVTSASVGGDPTTQYEAALEKRMTDILDAINGVSDAKVLITMDSSEQTVYATDTTNNSQKTVEDAQGGGTRTTTQVDQSGKIVLINQNGTNQPVVEKVIRPQIRGVLVVAKGAEQIRIQALITDAIERALDVPYHKISIQPEKQS